jgi:ferredoxin-nitrite reductase
VNDEFTEEQKRYLEGFAAGVMARRSAPADGAAAPSGPDAIHRAAQDRQIAAGGKLTAEEQAKRDKHPFDMWDELTARAAADQFPKGTDIFLTKYHGLFYVAPAQNSFMCRLRMPGGILSAHQFRGLADAAESFGGGYTDITTRANLQIREIAAKDAPALLMAIQDLGLTSRGSGADNIRNITGSPTAGIDPQELIDTRPLARELHHHILNHREMYGLPRKFNIAFDGGGRVAVLEDTNDIAFTAVRVDGEVVFRLGLGGITGHKDFARETGIVVAPRDCTPVAAAVVRAFIEHGDRTDRTKARLKYVLDRLGLEKFLDEAQKHLAFPLRRIDPAAIEPRPALLKHGHIGVHKQPQAGLNYLGVVVPVGRLTAEQMRALADIAIRYGSGTIRLTVWQNLLISDVRDADVESAIAALKASGLSVSTSHLRGGLIACTGNAGCKFAASNTKAHALTIAEHIDARLALDQPINIHLTGCHHSCAQHYIGDIGLLAAKIEHGEEMVEGYVIHVGGGYATEQRIAREVWPALGFDEVPRRIERMLRAYLTHRSGPEESFFAFTVRHEIEALRRLFEAAPLSVAA